MDNKQDIYKISAAILKFIEAVETAEPTIADNHTHPTTQTQPQQQPK